MKLEEIRVSTFEQFCEEVGRIARTEKVGLLVIGADSDFKLEVCREIHLSLQPSLRPSGCWRYRDVTVESVKLFLQKEPIAMLVLSSEESWNNVQRLSAVTLLRQSGCKDVIGVFVKPRQRLQSEMDESVRQFLAQCPPAAEETDLLWIFKDE